MNPEVRLHTSEQLDNLSLSGKALNTTLRSLGVINRFLGNHQQLNKAVVHYTKTYPSTKKIHILDLGCGGGDCILKISKKLKKIGIAASFKGIDGNPESVAYALQNNPDPLSIDYSTADILSKKFIIPDCDLLISSHFIYHFKNEDLIDFLKKIKSKKVKHVIFSELYRSKVAYYIFKRISSILPISDMAKKDGLIAIQRAFTVKELKEIIENSGIKKYSIIKKPFFRMIVKIHTNNETNTI
ncbi:methyltransferase domain-containing protein [Aquimarina algiphila]|uniref:methyltransferase domain-containing protein n=1 Tax=Aquimarina algiphila TaxID=2047982 RepID=UPI00232DB8AE|nr:methyltransferase domain-containing protein [Aquimarina algiphila]